MGQRAKLLLFSGLFAVIGLVLIFVVAPELTEKWSALLGMMRWEQPTPEYWAAMIGGGASLVTAAGLLVASLIQGNKSEVSHGNEEVIDQQVQLDK